MYNKQTMCKNSNICCIGPGHNHQTLFAGRHTSNSLFQNKRHNIQPSYHIRWRPQVRRTSTQAIGNESQDTSSPLLLDEIRRSFTTRHASRSIKQEGKPRICVLGAGVIGLTTAIRLTRAIPDAQVTMYAGRFASDVTSHNAAGVWEPYKLSETPEMLTYRWSKETFDHLMGLVHSDQAVAAGVQMMYCHNLYLTEEPDPFWSPVVHGFRRMDRSELELFSKPVDWPSIQVAAAAVLTSGNRTDTPGDGSIDSFSAAERATGFVDGYTFNTVVCEGRLYMRWLQRQLAAAGVQQIQRKLSSLADVANEGWDVVINCCGLGAERLVPDPHCYPIRGQIMRVKAPWVTQCVFAHFPDETSYIIPNRNWVVLGGTGQVGNYSTDVSVADAAKIADRAIQVVPSLKHAELLDHWVGLRPGRVRLRLEPETLSHGVLQQAAERAAAAQKKVSHGVDEVHSAVGLGRLQGLKVVHNYGHGGSGLTLAWGTAGDAVQLALQMLQ